MNKNLRFLISLVVLFMFSCRSSHNVYEADWFLIEAKIDNESVLNHIEFRNMVVDFEKNGLVPLSNIDGLSSTKTGESNFLYLKEGKQDFVVIDVKDSPSDYFDGKFEVLLADENGCSVSFSTERKKFFMLFNKEITNKVRRKCPPIQSVLDSLGIHFY